MTEGYRRGLQRVDMCVAVSCIVVGARECRLHCNWEHRARDGVDAASTAIIGEMFRIDVVEADRCASRLNYAHPGRIWHCSECALECLLQHRHFVVVDGGVHEKDDRGARSTVSTGAIIVRIEHTESI